MIVKSNNLPYIEGVGVLSIYHIYWKWDSVFVYV